MTHGTRTQLACLQSALDGIAASARTTEGYQFIQRNAAAIERIKRERAAEERTSR